MKQSVIAGVVLGVVVAVWSLIFIGIGLHKLGIGGLAFAVVAMVINVAVVIWSLRKTRAEGRRYGGQVLSGLVLAVVGAVLIFGSSLLLTQVVFPNATEEQIAAQEDMMLSMGAPEEQVHQAIERARAAGPVAQARNGAIATVVTTLLVTLIAAIFIRAKTSPAASPTP